MEHTPKYYKVRHCCPGMVGCQPDTPQTPFDSARPLTGKVRRALLLPFLAFLAAFLAALAGLAVLVVLRGLPRRLAGPAAMPNCSNVGRIDLDDSVNVLLAFGLERFYLEELAENMRISRVLAFILPVHLFSRRS
jgi:hypothetical protein